MQNDHIQTYINHLKMNEQLKSKFFKYVYRQFSELIPHVQPSEGQHIFFQILAYTNKPLS